MNVDVSQWLQLVEELSVGALVAVLLALYIGCVVVLLGKR